MSRRSGDELSAPLPAKRSKVVYALATPRSGSLSSTCRQRRLGWHRACLRALRLAGPNGSGGTWRAERRAVRRTRAAPPVVVEFAQSPPSQGSGGKPPPGTAASRPGGRPGYKSGLALAAVLSQRADLSALMGPG
jgi:hypothetical protein